MDQLSSLESWKKHIELLESKTDTNNPKNFEDFAILLEHLSPITAPRLQKEYESCTTRSHQVLGELFDHIDLSNKPLLCSFLRLLRSFGYYRIAQITNHVQGPGDNLNSDLIYLPTIEKSKWHDVCPILPAAGTITWKSIMNHGLVKDEKEMMQVCIQLLTQKLHFYSIISLMEYFQDSLPIIRRNGEKVVTKLFELIRDIAYDDDSMIGLDSALFNLLIPFANQDQQAAIIDATVQDLFKPHLLLKPIREEEIEEIYELIANCIMVKSNLQDILVAKLLEHLTHNGIRRKRRHSVESIQDNEDETLESLLNQINNGEKLNELLPKMSVIKVSSKSLQTNYISYWVQVLDRILSCRVVTANSALKIIASVTSLLVVTSQILNPDLIERLSSIMANATNYTSQTTKLLAGLDHNTIIELTKVLSETSLFFTFDAPILLFYKSYIRRCCACRGKIEAEKLSAFVTFICDKSLNKDTSHILQFIYLSQIANFYGGSKIPETNLNGVKTCSKKLHKFIKKKIKLQHFAEDGSLVDSSEEIFADTGKTIAIDAFASILRIAFDQKDQEILDSYGDLLLNLYGSVLSRIRTLIDSVSVGKTELQIPIDSQLSRLLSLYLRHRDMIQVYLDFDLVQSIISSIILGQPTTLNGFSGSVNTKGNKKIVYNRIKTKLEELGQRAEKSRDVYQTIINKQYTSAIDQTIGSTGDIQREKTCFDGYFHQIKTLGDFLVILLAHHHANNQIDSYRRILNSTIDSLEHCDPLDHPKVLFLFLMLESLIPKDSRTKDSQTSAAFKEVIPKISCSLIRISKSVELGPSIHVFTRSGSHKSNRGIQCCTYANCIKIYTLIFQSYPAKVTGPYISDAMQICISSNLIQYSKNSTRLYKFFIHLASSISGLLKSICAGRKDEEILQSSMPVFLSVFSHLIRCLILASDRRKLEDLPKIHQNGFSSENYGEDEKIAPLAMCESYEAQLKLLAIDIARALNTLSSLKIKMVDFAPHLISTYIKDIQRAACPDYIKLHLNEGIFRIFNLIDAHQKERREGIIEAGVQRKTVAGRASGSLFEMIHSRLDQASREIFKDMHDNYSRFHRYLGKC